MRAIVSIDIADAVSACLKAITDKYPELLIQGIEIKSHNTVVLMVDVCEGIMTYPTRHRINDTKKERGHITCPLFNSRSACPKPNGTAHQENLWNIFREILGSRCAGGCPGTDTAPYTGTDDAREHVVDNGGIGDTQHANRNQTDHSDKRQNELVKSRVEKTIHNSGDPLRLNGLRFGKGVD
jgi:hypothetical protein